MSNKNQASLSDVNDSLGHTSKDRQRPAMANSQPGTTSHHEESLGGRAKKKPVPAHVGPQNEPGQERDSLNERQINRVSRTVPQDAKEIPGGARKARNAGPHGSVIHANGSSQAAPNRHNVAKIG